VSFSLGENEENLNTIQPPFLCFSHPQFILFKKKNIEVVVFSIEIFIRNLKRKTFDEISQK